LAHFYTKSLEFETVFLKKSQQNSQALTYLPLHRFRTLHNESDLAFSYAESKLGSIFHSLRT